MDAITADLAAEHESLDALVRDLPDEAWELPTPAPGWAVRDQISHLCFFDDKAVEAATDPEAFLAGVAATVEAADGDPSVVLGRTVLPAGLLARWRDGRARM